MSDRRHGAAREFESQLSGWRLQLAASGRLTARLIASAALLFGCADRGGTGEASASPPAPKVVTTPKAAKDPAPLPAAPSLTATKEAAPPRRPRLRNPSRGPFPRRVAAQATRFPDAFFLEATGPSRAVALTFDDGPDPVATRRLLRVLDRHRARATFFVVGSRARRWPQLVRAIARRGHAVAGHGYQHVMLSKLPAARAYTEHVARTNVLLTEILGTAPLYFRPPFGHLTDEQIRYFAERGVRSVNWSVDSYDTNDRYNGVSAMKRRVLRHIHDGAIVLMHSLRHRPNTAAALPHIIAELKRRGYALRTVPELLACMSHRSGSRGPETGERCRPKNGAKP